MYCSVVYIYAIKSIIYSFKLLINMTTHSTVTSLLSSQLSIDHYLKVTFVTSMASKLTENKFETILKEFFIIHH